MSAVNHDPTCKRRVEIPEPVAADKALRAEIRWCLDAKSRVYTVELSYTIWLKGGTAFGRPRPALVGGYSKIVPGRCVGFAGERRNMANMETKVMPAPETSEIALVPQVSAVPEIERRPGRFASDPDGQDVWSFSRRRAERRLRSLGRVALQLTTTTSCSPKLIRPLTGTADCPDPPPITAA
jgi:hypothetical protein